MCKRSIAALVWLLLIAIPVQGFAAAAMTYCGAHHHSGAGATQVDHALHDHGAAIHDHALGYAANPEPVVDIDAPGFDHNGYAKCSACAACCLGVALLSNLTTPPPAVPSVTASCGVFASALEVVVNGPERPPRPLLV